MMLSPTGEESSADIVTVFISMVAKEQQGYEQISYTVNISHISLDSKRTYQPPLGHQFKSTSPIFVRLLRPSFASLRIYRLRLSVVL
jgi:hypothetical protein